MWLLLGSEIRKADEVRGSICGCSGAEGRGESLTLRLRQGEMFLLLHFHELISEFAIHSFTYIFNEYLLHACFVPGTLLGSGIVRRDLWPQGEKQMHNQPQLSELE